MRFFETHLQGSYVIELAPFKDQRGMFARTYCKREFRQINHTREFVQFNHSLTYKKGAIRGMHYQVHPDCEIKLIRCMAGKVFDVIIDLRGESPTFLEFFTVELSPDNLKMIYVPEGFAHGFQTLEDDTQLIYHHTGYYNPESERGIRYNDPFIGINWPLYPTDISEKDQHHQLIDKTFKGIKL
jgi:dTDP-4-dehydrorhamnose 3,5-epimerase